MRRARWCERSWHDGACCEGSRREHEGNAKWLLGYGAGWAGDRPANRDRAYQNGWHCGQDAREREETIRREREAADDCGNDCDGPGGHAEACPVHCHCYDGRG